MESAVALKGKDFVIIATDSAVKNSYLVLKREEDKFININDKVLFTYLGDQGDAFRTANFVSEKLIYEEVDNNLLITPSLTANLIQNITHSGLRTNPRNNYFVVGGLSNYGTELYSIDIYGSMHESKFMAVGIATYFCYGILEKEYHDDISVEQGIAIINKCYNVLKDKCATDITDVDLRIISRDGVRAIKI
ncbi:hypothetical protein P3W45_000653 [Vairimorpha bombi]|jgi:20S proteasome subunit beta 4